MKSKYLVLGIFVLAAIFVSGCYHTGQPVQPPAPQPSPAPSGEAKTVTVEFTSEGYSPSTVRINAGDTVRFVNTNTEPHWVASNPHPIHTDLRGFDARRPIQPGEEYSYTFTEEGEWGCHDHLNPARMCTIIVE